MARGMPLRASIMTGHGTPGHETGISATFQGYEDQGGTLRREATSGNVTQGSSRFTITMADFRVESGTAATAQFQFSRDGGPHFGPVRYRSVGAVGNYDQRVQFHNLGMQREICAPGSMHGQR